MARLTGTSNRDILNGTGEDDLIRGLDGDDSIFGRDGADDIDAGAGDDYVDAGDGNDTVVGGDGDDRILGGLGDDLLKGDEGNDTIEGGAGRDEIYGGSGNDTIHAGGHHDKIYGGNGSDTIFGDAGNDKIFGGAGADEIHGGAGADRLAGQGGADTIFGDAGNDTIIAGAGDTIDGGTEIDKVIFKFDFDVSIITETEDGFVVTLDGGPITITNVEKFVFKGEERIVMTAEELSYAIEQAAAQTYHLTSNTDNGPDFVGTAGNDRFIAHYETVNDGIRIDTLTQFDDLDGGDGHDTLEVTAAAAFDMTGAVANSVNVQDIENVEFEMVGDLAIEMDHWDGVEDITVTSTGGNVYVKSTASESVTVNATGIVTVSDETVQDVTVETFGDVYATLDDVNSVAIGTSDSAYLTLNDANSIAVAAGEDIGITMDDAGSMTLLAGEDVNINADDVTTLEVAAGDAVLAGLGNVDALDINAGGIVSLGMGNVTTSAEITALGDVGVNAGFVQEMSINSGGSVSGTISLAADLDVLATGPVALTLTQGGDVDVFSGASVGVTSGPLDNLDIEAAGPVSATLSTVTNETLISSGSTASVLMGDSYGAVGVAADGSVTFMGLDLNDVSLFSSDGSVGGNMNSADTVLVDGNNVTLSVGDSNLIDVAGNGEITVGVLNAEDIVVDNAAEVGIVSVAVGSGGADSVTVTMNDGGVMIEGFDGGDIGTVSVTANDVGQFNPITIPDMGPIMIGMSSDTDIGAIDVTYNSGDVIIAGGDVGPISVTDIDGPDGMFLVGNGVAVNNIGIVTANTPTVDLTVENVYGGVVVLSNGSDAETHTTTLDLTVNGEANTLVFSDDFNTAPGTSELETINVDGDADLFLDVRQLSDTLTEVDAGAATGDLYVLATAEEDGSLTVTTGSGNDDIIVDGGSDAVVTLHAGEGDNYILANLTPAHPSVMTITAGDGVDHAEVDAQSLFNTGSSVDVGLGDNTLTIHYNDAITEDELNAFDTTPVSGIVGTLNIASNVDLGSDGNGDVTLDLTGFDGEVHTLTFSDVDTNSDGMPDELTILGGAAAMTIESFGSFGDTSDAMLILDAVGVTDLTVTQENAGSNGADMGLIIEDNATLESLTVSGMDQVDIDLNNVTGGTTVDIYGENGRINLDIEGSNLGDLTINTGVSDDEGMDVTVDLIGDVTLGNVTIDANDINVDSDDGVGDIEFRINDQDEVTITVGNMVLTAVDGEADLTISDNDGASITVGNVTATGSDADVVIQDNNASDAFALTEITVGDISLDSDNGNGSLVIQNNSAWGNAANTDITVGDVWIRNFMDDSFVQIQGNSDDSVDGNVDIVVGDIDLYSATGDVYVDLDDNDKSTVTLGRVDGQTNASAYFDVNNNNGVAVNDRFYLTVSDVVLFAGTDAYVDLAFNDYSTIEIGNISLASEGGNRVTLQDNDDAIVTLGDINVDNPFFPTAASYVGISDNEDSVISIGDITLESMNEATLEIGGFNGCDGDGNDFSTITISDVDLSAANTSIVIADNYSATVALGDVEIGSWNYSDFDISDNDDATITIGTVNVSTDDFDLDIFDNDNTSLTIGNLTVYASDDGAEVDIVNNDNSTLTFGNISLSSSDNTDYEITIDIVDNDGTTMTAGDISIYSGEDASVEIVNNDLTNITLGSVDVISTTSDAVFVVDANVNFGLSASDVTVAAADDAYAAIINNVGAGITLGDVTASGTQGLIDVVVSNNDISTVTTGDLTASSLNVDAGVYVIDNDDTTLTFGDVTVDGIGGDAIFQVTGNDNTPITFGAASVTSVGVGRDVDVDIHGGIVASSITLDSLDVSAADRADVHLSTYATLNLVSDSVIDVDAVTTVVALTSYDAGSMAITGLDLSGVTGSANVDVDSVDLNLGEADAFTVTMGNADLRYYANDAEEVIRFVGTDIGDILIGDGYAYDGGDIDAGLPDLDMVTNAFNVYEDILDFSDFEGLSSTDLNLQLISWMDDYQDEDLDSLYITFDLDTGVTGSITLVGVTDTDLAVGAMIFSA